MKRFLMLVGVAAVAAAMYVAASPASQQSRFATEKQFLALQKKVATLNKTLKTVKAEADFAVGAIASCYLKDNGNNTFSFSVMPVSQFGTASSGFLFGTSGANIPRSALDVATASPQAYLQKVDPSCVSLVFTAARNGAIRQSRLQQWAERTR